jgi:hypothetical protein
MQKKFDTNTKFLRQPNCSERGGNVRFIEWHQTYLKISWDYTFETTVHITCCYYPITFWLGMSTINQSTVSIWFRHFSLTGKWEKLSKMIKINSYIDIEGSGEFGLDFVTKTKAVWSQNESKKRNEWFRFDSFVLTLYLLKFLIFCLGTCFHILSM